jgi:hypothetical protein
MPPRLQSILSVLLAPFLPVLALFMIASAADACTPTSYTDVGVPNLVFDPLPLIVLYFVIALGGLWLLWRLTGASRLARAFGVLAYLAVHFLFFFFSGDRGPLNG